MDPTPARPADVTVTAPDPAGPPGGWLRQNAPSLAVVGLAVGLVCYYLHPLDVLLAGPA